MCLQLCSFLAGRKGVCYSFKPRKEKAVSLNGYIMVVWLFSWMFVKEEVVFFNDFHEGVGLSSL